jgi:hypothetical protein
VVPVVLLDNLEQMDNPELMVLEEKVVLELLELPDVVAAAVVEEEEEDHLQTQDRQEMLELLLADLAVVLELVVGQDFLVHRSLDNQEILEVLVLLVPPVEQWEDNQGEQEQREQQVHQEHHQHWQEQGNQGEQEQREQQVQMVRQELELDLVV